MNSNRIPPAAQATPTQGLAQGGLNHQGEVPTTGAPYIPSGDIIYRETHYYPNGLPDQGLPVGSVPLQNAPYQNAVLQSVPPQSAPLQSAPVQSVPLQSAPVQSVPLQSAPLQSVPLHSVPLHSAPLQSAPLHSAPLQSVPLHSAPVAGPAQHATIVKPRHFEPVNPKLTPAYNPGNVSKKPVKKWPTVVSASEELHKPSVQMLHHPQEVSRPAAELVPTVNEIPIDRPFVLGRVVPATNVLPSASAPLYKPEVIQPAINNAINKVADVVQPAVNTAINTAEAIPNAINKAADVVQPAVNSAINTAADIGHATAEAIPNAINKAADVVQPAVNSAINTAADIGQATVDTAANAIPYVADVGRAAAELGQAAAEVALHKAADVVIPATAAALHKVADIGEATAETAANAAPYIADVGRAAAGLGQAAAGLALHKAADVGQGALHAAADLGQGALHAAADVGQAAASTTASAVYKAADIGQGALHAAADVGQAAASTTASAVYKAADLGHAVAGVMANKAANLGHGIADMARAAVSGVYNKAAGLGNSVIQGVDDYVNHYITSAQRTWLKGQEEIEKLRRQTDLDEHWAMLNAFETARCMRGYLEQINRPVPLSGRNVDAYGAKLLENVEMRRRCAHDSLGAKKNAAEVVGMLMNTRFNPHSDLCIEPLRLQRVQKKVPTSSSSSPLDLPATTSPAKSQVTPSPLEGLSQPAPVPSMPSAAHAVPSLPAHQQHLASHSAPLHEDQIVSAPRSVSGDNLQAPPLAELRAHHVPPSAVNATPFVPPAGYPLTSSGGLPQSAPFVPPAGYPLPISGGLTQSGGLSYTVPPVPVLGGSGNVVIFYPVMAQSDPKDSNQPFARPAL